MDNGKKQNIQMTLFDYFKDVDSFTLHEAQEITKEVLEKKVKIPSIRARIYEGVDKGLFEWVSRGIYRIRDGNTQSLVINGDGRDLTGIEDDSIDAIVTDHPYDLKKTCKGGNRNFSKYDTFQYNEDDFKEKFRVLKNGGFLVEMIPEESGDNWEYLSKIKKMAIECGFVYYTKVPWKKGEKKNNTGRKSSNTEDVIFFTKGKARSLRLDTKKNKKKLIELGIWERKMSSIDMENALIKNKMEVSYMSGTNGMLPTVFDYEPTEKNECVHPSEKPIGLYQSIIKHITKQGEWILDQYAGSFNLARASLIEKRNSISYELDENYVNEFLKRI